MKEKNKWHLKISSELSGIIWNYGYRNIIVDDLQDFRVEELQKLFINSKIVTLCPEDEEVEKRIKIRNEGWKNIEEAIKWNQKMKERNLPNEYKIDNTFLTPEGTVVKILENIQ